mmetsp:Transcript_17101/g.19065  ORF Transcript_17101/g.19065 Transcript_17101/m.19065 type:complete len:194 (+) Transcript_17101:30-611(+)
MPKGTNNTPIIRKEKPVTTKILLVGDSGCYLGKSSIIKRYTENTFIDTYEMSLGVEFFKKHKQGKVIKDINIQIWDTSGRERGLTDYRRGYVRGCHIILVVFDVTQRKTYENIANFEEILKLKKDKRYYVAIVGNKIDLKDKREVSKEEGCELANYWGVSYFEVSAKEGTGVFEMFDKMVSKAEDICIKEGRH